MKFDDIIINKTYPNGQPYRSICKDQKDKKYADAIGGYAHVIGSYEVFPDGFIPFGKRKKVESEEEVIIRIIKSRINKIEEEKSILLKLLSR